jgi:transposase-like protein
MNLFSLAKAFPDEDAALDYWIRTRWPSGVACVGCGALKIYRIVTPNKSGKNVRLFECAQCGLHFSPTAGTLFHDSHLPLQKWFMAIALMCESKKGISANQMKRHLGVTYKTAWYLCHRIRKAMSDTDIAPLGERGQIVEIDETFVGGSIPGGGSDGKQSKIKVFGAAERGGRVHLQRIKNLKNETLKPIIDARISPNVSQIVTDGAHGYKSLIPREKHFAGNHFQELKKGQRISNNTIEGAFSLFKRGIVGQYHQLGVEHIDAYLSEFCWRFNRRHVQYKMFGMVLSNLTANPPLPYKQLTAKNGPESELPPF